MTTTNDRYLYIICVSWCSLYILCLCCVSAERAFCLACYGRTLYASEGMDRRGNVDGGGDFPPQNACRVQVFSRLPS